MSSTIRVKQMAHLKQKQISDKSCKAIIIDTLLEAISPLTPKELSREIAALFHVLVSSERLPVGTKYTGLPQNQERYGWQVDYIFTHCAPSSVARRGSRHDEAAPLTDSLQEVQDGTLTIQVLPRQSYNQLQCILLWKQLVLVP